MSELKEWTASEIKEYSWFTTKEKTEYGYYVGNILYGAGGIAPFLKCYKHYKPSMKGGHRHNHIYNVCNRITFRGKKSRRVNPDDKKYFVKNFWANIALMPDELNKILAKSRRKQKCH